MKPNCLIVDLMHPSIIDLLEEAGFHVSYRPEIKPGEVKAALKGFRVLMVRSKLHISEELLSEAEDLQIVARAGAGVDNIDEDALKRRNIQLVNAPEGNRDAVGEFTVGLLLALFRNIAKADKEVRNLDWHREANRGEEIFGKTIGIIGYGNMGKVFARCLSGFNCRVIANDIAPDATFDENAERVSLSEIFEQADVVSFHIPYTPENYHFANAAFFGSFSKNVWVLSTARGEIMDYSALVGGLKAGNLKGAALDVLENEKLSTLNAQQKENFGFLAKAPNVILTPHIAGWTHQSYQKINEILVQKIKTLQYQDDGLR
ncbi:phosphoglycerate dehydrogenase [Adhaeribacter sp. BT258]|uniref:Phosphoglycerate dehydrogenase n=1 Tax=Adhaeribacter terrigena TaxID=2793070 RepID=A0ABS1C1Y8_9BACT|nr:NAD(P)-dependent oxidoreductase [Adhaeribacter terrigena]MBK0402575.1 phosphoglycerate dehydrogenase [Adhaeribacter terrigena]